MNDATWLEAGESRYSTMISNHYGSPDTIASGGDLRVAASDPAAALFFYQKAIDTLHSIYLAPDFNGVGASLRQPSDRDIAIVDRYTATIREVRSLHPASPIQGSLMYVTNMIRDIAGKFTRCGLDNSQYGSCYSELTAIARDI